MARSATWLPLSVHWSRPLPAAVAATWCVSWSPQQWVAEGLAVGDSIAVDGVCLTARKLLEHGFDRCQPRDLVPHHLGERARSGAAVTCSPALRRSSRRPSRRVATSMVGAESISRQGTLDLQLGWHDPRLGRCICEKGSVAANGITTVASCYQTAPASACPDSPPGQTTLQELRCGDAVNLEADLLKQYVERTARVGQLIHPSGWPRMVECLAFGASSLPCSIIHDRGGHPADRSAFWLIASSSLVHRHCCSGCCSFGGVIGWINNPKVAAARRVVFWSGRFLVAGWIVDQFQPHH